MFVRSASFALSLALAVGSIAIPVAAQDDDRARARTEFQRGVEAYSREDYTAALAAFQEAYRLAPHPVVRVNIANSYERAGRPLEALFHFERFLTESESVTPQQRREVETAIRRLRGQVGEIELHIAPDGATVTIDDAEQRRAPVTEPVRVTTGAHSVVVQLDGFETERREVQVEGGETTRVEVRLARATAVASTGTTGTATETTSEPATTEPVTVADTTPAAVAVAPPEEPSGDDGGFQITTPVWIAGGITIAAAIGAGVTGGLALAANSDYERHLATYEDSAQPADVREQARASGLSSADSAETLALVTDVLLITTIVGAGATVFFLITTQDGGLLGDEAPQPAVAVVPLLGDGLAGVVVAGAF